MTFRILLAAALLLSGLALPSRPAPAEERPAPITVFVAKKIVTMDPGWPTATAVAVRDGRILSVGRTLADLAPWLERNPHTIDKRFEGKVLLPGFIEAHGHPLIGGFLMTRRLTAFKDIQNPYGPAHKGLRTREAALARLRDYDRQMPDAGELLLSFGFDTVRFGGHLTRAELDQVSATRPIAVLDNSQHFVYGNTAFLRSKGFTPELAERLPGTQLDAKGELSGQFLGTTAAAFVLRDQMAGVLQPSEGFRVIDYLVDVSRQGGITTQSELVLGIADLDAEAKLYGQYFSDPSRPMRLVAVVDAASLRAQKKEGALAAYLELQERSTDKLIFKGIKAFSDDSFTGLGMAVEDPGYLDGRTGIYIHQGPALVDLLLPYWKAGAHVHVHSNGNAGQENTLAALAELLRLQPRFDHRFTFEHTGMLTYAQARRMKALGAVASLNPYYVRDWAGVNERYLGTDRAHLADRFRTLVDLGVVVSMHSDTPVGAARPLEWVWIAVNRIGESGQVLAPDERVSVEQALRMITIDAAYTLGVDDRLGSIEAGKLADFTVLEKSPFDVPRDGIRNIGIWGTVVGGRVSPASGIRPR